MHQPNSNPLLLPDRRPVDVDHCDPAALLNPPHLGRLTWDPVRGPNDTGDEAPDWSLLIHPAA